MKELIQIAGLGQILLAVASFTVPRVLGWRAEVAKLRPLTRQVFWTYAAYISLTNLLFGVLSVLGAPRLLDNTLLAGVVCAYIASWWGARVVIQFTYYDRSAAPDIWWARPAEAGLVLLFAYCAALYGWVAVRTLL